MPKNDPENGMRSESGIHYYTLRKLSEYNLDPHKHIKMHNKKLINIIIVFV